MKKLCCVLMGAAILARVSSFGQGSPATPPPAGGIQPPAQPSEPAHTVLPAPAIPPKPIQLSDYLVFDADQKEYVAANGEPQAHYTFFLTNISQEPVTIQSVKTSCGCTTAHLASMPWTLPAGTNGQFDVTMNLAGKRGVVFKTVTVSTDKGNKVLMVKVTVMPGTEGGSAMGSREMNQKIAQQDRQAVFKGDCVQCHVLKGVGKTGRELYAADCGICHEAEHRASMVPDLRHPPTPLDRGLWQIWIAYGKPGSMMPAFAQSEGGPLSEKEIQALADYLSRTITSTSASPQAK